MFSSVSTFCERLAAAGALIALSPILALAALCIVIESGRPILFRQTRVGQDGRTFSLWKLRSMRVGRVGTPITAGGDRRVTAVGAFLRKYKLDELPQFWNVAVGEMQLIGPRPEVPQFVNMADPMWRELLRHKPGLTDLSSLVYRNEEEILAQSADPMRAYAEEVLPRKVRLSSSYSRKRTLASDCRLLLLTAKYSLFPARFQPGDILRNFLEQG